MKAMGCNKCWKNRSLMAHTSKYGWVVTLHRQTRSPSHCQNYYERSYAAQLL